MTNGLTAIPFPTAPSLYVGADPGDPTFGRFPRCPFPLPFFPEALTPSRLSLRPPRDPPFPTAHYDNIFSLSSRTPAFPEPLELIPFFFNAEDVTPRTPTPLHLFLSSIHVEGNTAPLRSRALKNFASNRQDFADP